MHEALISVLPPHKLGMGGTPGILALGCWRHETQEWGVLVHLWLQRILAPKRKQNKNKKKKVVVHCGTPGFCNTWPFSLSQELLTSTQWKSPTAFQCRTMSQKMKWVEWISAAPVQFLAIRLLAALKAPLCCVCNQSCRQSTASPVHTLGIFVCWGDHSSCSVLVCTSSFLTSSPAFCLRWLLTWSLLRICMNCTKKSPQMSSS